MIDDEDFEEAELENPEEDEEKFIDRHWLLIVGLGLVGIGLLIRWMMRKR